MAGDSTNQEEWNPLAIRPEDIKVSKRKPKWKKDGSANWKHDIPKTGSIRGGGMVGGVVDAQSGTHKGTVKHPVEDLATNNLDELL